MRKTVGILGGMGPEATLDFFEKVIRATPAEKDQDHLRIFIDNNPQIPDRTDAILYGEKSPLGALTASAQGLEKMGAHGIAVPCNTAHYYHSSLQAGVSIPVFNMIEETGSELASLSLSSNRVGLLATDGTVAAEIYHHVLSLMDVEVVVPDGVYQRLVMESIYGKKGIKAGWFREPKEQILKVVHYLEAQDCKAVIAGCTEIPLVLSSTDASVPVLDPTEILAKTVVKFGLGEGE